MHYCFLHLHHFIKRLSQRKEVDMLGKCSLITRLELCGGLAQKSYLPSWKAKHCSRATLVKMVAFACFEEEKNKKKTTISRTLVQRGNMQNPPVRSSECLAFWHLYKCPPPSSISPGRGMQVWPQHSWLSLPDLQTDHVLAGTVFHSAQSLEKKCHRN